MLQTASGNIPIKIATDPCIAPVQTRQYIAGKSGLDIQLLKTQADSFSSSNISVTISPPSSTQTDLLLQMYFDGIWDFTYTPSAPGVVLFNGADTSGPPGTHFLGGNDCVRWMPVQAFCSSIALSLNGTVQSFEPSQFLEAVSRYGLLPTERDMFDSTYPSYQDEFFTFALANGTNRSAMGRYGDNVLVNSRAGMIGYTIVSDDPVNGTAQVRFQWVEPLLVSPFSPSAKGLSGLFDLQTLRLNMTLSDMDKNWCHDLVNNPAVINSVRFSWNSPPIFETRHVTPISPLSIPFSQLYEAVNIQRFTTEVNNVPSNIEQVLNFPNARLNSIPSKLYIFIRKSDRTINDPEFYCPINNISINFGNKSAQIASYTPHMLFKMNSQNGYTLSWTQDRYYVGSVICVNLAKDLSLDLHEATGLRQDCNIQVSVRYTNQTGNDLNVQGQLIVVFDGIFSLSKNGGSSLTFGPLLPGDVLKGDLLSSAKSADFLVAENENFYAGKIDWKSAGTKLLKFGKEKVLPQVKKYAPDIIRTGVSLAAPRLSNVTDEALKLFGMGYSAGKIQKHLMMNHPNLKPNDIKMVMKSIKSGRGTRGGRYIQNDEAENLINDFSDRI